jgi:hypothetical protein
VRALLLALAACSTATTTKPGVRWAPIVDSHVHLSYDPVADQLAQHGVLAAVDLAAPEASLGRP